MKLGVNVLQLESWAKARPFQNEALQAAWPRTDGFVGPATYAAGDYAAGTTYMLLLTDGDSLPTGDYVWKVSGNAAGNVNSVTVNGNGASTGPNSFTVSGSPPVNVWLDFTVSATTAMADVQFEVYPAGFRSGGTWKPEFADALRPFRQCVRLMDWNGAFSQLDGSAPFPISYSASLRPNTTTSTHWSGTTFTNTGVRAKFCNVPHAERIWLCVPLYIGRNQTKFLSWLNARLNQIPTSTKVYVELSNELWNTNFPQHGVLDDASFAEFGAGIPGPERNAIVASRWAKEMKDWVVAAELQGRVQVVFAWQNAASGSFPFTSPPWLGGNPVHPEAVANIQAIGRVAVAPYFGSGVTSLANLSASITQPIADLETWRDDVTDALGIKLLCYEAGQHVENQPESWQNSPEMLAAIDEYLDELETALASDAEVCWYGLANGWDAQQAWGLIETFEERTDKYRLVASRASGYGYGFPRQERTTTLGSLVNGTSAPWRGSPNQGHGDVFAYHDPVAGLATLYFGARNTIAYSEQSPFNPDNILQQWSETPADPGSPSWPIAQLYGIEGTASEDGLDTPCLMWHPVLQKWFLYHQVIPGTTPNGEAGSIFAIQAASSTNPTHSSRVWVRHPGFVLQADQAWEGGFQVFEGEPPSQIVTWRGGVSECSFFWEPRLGRTVAFYRGHNEISPGGAHRWRLGRAVEDAALDGLTFTKDADYVFSPYEDTPSGYSGAATSGAHHYSVHRDPTDGSYHCFYLHAIGTSNWGVHHMRSDALGVKGSWVVNPANPLITISSISADLGGGEGLPTKVGAPCLLPDLASGKLFVFFDGAPVQRYVNAGVFVAESSVERVVTVGVIEAGTSVGAASTGTSGGSQTVAVSVQEAVSSVAAPAVSRVIQVPPQDVEFQVCDCPVVQETARLVLGQNLETGVGAVGMARVIPVATVELTTSAPAVGMDRAIAVSGQTVSATAPSVGIVLRVAAIEVSTSTAGASVANALVPAVLEALATTGSVTVSRTVQVPAQTASASTGMVGVEGAHLVEPQEVVTETLPVQVSRVVTVPALTAMASVGQVSLDRLLTLAAVSVTATTASVGMGRVLRPATQPLVTSTPALQGSTRVVAVGVVELSTSTPSLGSARVMAVAVQAVSTETPAPTSVGVVILFPAAQQAVATITSPTVLGGSVARVRFPSPFVVSGRMLTDGGSFATDSSESDPHVRVSDDGTQLELLFCAYEDAPQVNTEAPRPLQIGYAEMPIDGDPLADWSASYEAGDPESLQMAATPTSRHRNGVTGPHVVRHSALGGLKLLFFAQDPGVRPADSGGNTHTGQVSSIAVATSPQPNGRLCRWCLGGDVDRATLVEPGNDWAQAYTTVPGPGVLEYAGGHRDPTAVERPGTDELLVFTVAESDSGLVLSRAVSTVTSGRIIRPIEDPAPVLSGIGGGADVILDPDGQTLHLVCQATDGHLDHYMSTGWGAAGTWTANPANPILRVDAAGLSGIVGTDVLGGPRLFIPSGGDEFWMVLDFRPAGGRGGVGAGLYLATSGRLLGL